MAELIIILALVGISPVAVGLLSGTWRLVQMIRDPMRFVDWHL